MLCFKTQEKASHEESFPQVAAAKIQRRSKESLQRPLHHRKTLRQSQEMSKKCPYSHWILLFFSWNCIAKATRGLLTQRVLEHCFERFELLMKYLINFVEDRGTDGFGHGRRLFLRTSHCLRSHHACCRLSLSGEKEPSSVK